MSEANLVKVVSCNEYQLFDTGAETQETERLKFMNYFEFR